MNRKTIKLTTHVYQSWVVAILDVVEHTSFVQAREFGHVFALVELGWVHLLYDIFVDEHAFAGLGYLHLDFVAALALDAGRHEALGLVRDPDETFLRPFRLCGLIVELIPVDGQVLHERIGTVGIHVHGCGGIDAGDRTNSRTANENDGYNWTRKLRDAYGVMTFDGSVATNTSGASGAPGWRARVSLAGRRSYFIYRREVVLLLWFPIGLDLLLFIN